MKNGCLKLEQIYQKKKVLENREKLFSLGKFKTKMQIFTTLALD